MSGEGVKVVDAYNHVFTLTRTDLAANRITSKMFNSFKSLVF